MRRHDWGDVATALFLLAAVYLLVRPGSLAPTVLGAFGDGLTNLITYAVSA